MKNTFGITLLMFFSMNLLAGEVGHLPTPVQDPHSSFTTDTHSTVAANKKKKKKKKRPRPRH